VPTYAQGLSTLFADLALPEGFMFTGDLAALEARYASASAMYGYPITPPAGFRTFMGTTQLLLGRTDRAIQILERAVELYPQSADVRDALGRALEAAGRAGVGPETETDPAPSLSRESLPDPLFEPLYGHSGHMDAEVGVVDEVGAVAVPLRLPPALLFVPVAGGADRHVRELDDGRLPMGVDRRCLVSILNGEGAPAVIPRRAPRSSR
jgi:tetratricopeptide (TPR) repeat protein